MENEKFEKILDQQFNGNYYTAKELQYGKKANVFLSPLEYKQFVEYEEERASNKDEILTLVPLKVFNFKCIYYCFGKDLKSTFETYKDLISSSSSFIDRFSKSFVKSRIYSEIEGSLNVENVPTTRRRLNELLEGNAPVKDKNDIIIKNMKEGIDFVNEIPEFNKENLFKLYSILSKDCLDEEDKLKVGEYYRSDSVEISRYHGCPYHLIEECMDSLFEYVKDVLTIKNKEEYLLTLLPHICHYYILYIHPYFDYNGRTARMVSYWIYLLTGVSDLPPIISEAINQTKNKYYEALEQTRDSHNDLTYFLKYLFNILNDYVIAYQNIEYIEEEVMHKGFVLTDTELNYIKRILISYKGSFSYLEFLKMAKVEMSKQGALKILNKFIEYGFLKQANSKTNTKLFDVNDNSVPYVLKNFGYSK